MKMIQFCDLSISEFCSAIQYYENANKYPMHNDGRRHHGFIYTFSGTETYKFENKSVRAKPNTVVYLPKDSRYIIDFEGTESFVIGIDFELEVQTDIEPFVIEFEDNNSISPLFEKAAAEWQIRKTAYNSVCMSLLYNIMGSCARIEEKFVHPGKYEKIRDAVEYLHLHYAEQNFRIVCLSELCGINSAYFARIFSDKFGISPKEYVTELKLKRARELLSQEKYTVSEIGALLGYSDVYHFSKSFKKGTGMSPIEWRSTSGK